MFDEVIKQVKRLFSSKSNAGKLVYSLTDRLHYYRIVLLFLCIILLLSYKQFREHFDCQSSGLLDKKALTNFCWTNATSTVERISKKGEVETQASASAPHAGGHFLSERHIKVDHSYMRNTWSLLVLMIACSFFAQRNWSLIFRNDILRATLKLPGYAELPIVRQSETSQPYSTLRSLGRASGLGSAASGSAAPAPEGAAPGKQAAAQQLTVLLETIERLEGEENEHEHSLDYYANQFIYLLIAKESETYRLSDLRLSSKLLRHSALSSLLTLFQFVLPYLLLGPRYTYYGWRFGSAWLKYSLRLLFDPRAGDFVDYARHTLLWPVSLSCEYRQYGLQGELEAVTVQCTVAINEICGKMFFVIWWAIAVGILVELLCLGWTLACALDAARLPGRLYWPKARREAKNVASFRYKRAKWLAAVKSGVADSGRRPSAPHLQREQRKEREHRGSSKSLRSQGDECNFVVSFASFVASQHKQFRKSRVEAKQLREKPNDPNIYCLFKLLYMRLNKSSRKVEKVIRMIDSALDSYLTALVDEVLVSRKREPGSDAKSRGHKQPDTVHPAAAGAVVDVML